MTQEKFLELLELEEKMEQEERELFESLTEEERLENERISRL